MSDAMGDNLWEMEGVREKTTEIRVRKEDWFKVCFQKQDKKLKKIYFSYKEMKSSHKEKASLDLLDFIQMHMNEVSESLSTMSSNIAQQQIVEKDH